MRLAALSVALFAVSACGGSKSNQTSAQTSSGTIAPSSDGVQIADVSLGRNLSADKRVANATDTFSARDTIYASVHTTGSASNTNIGARWTFQDGQVVSENTQPIAPSGDAYTEFHISKPSGWPSGNYTLHVLVNGQEAQTKNFRVQ
jgi:hypothetical protein